MTNFRGIGGPSFPGSNGPSGPNGPGKSTPSGQNLGPGFPTGGFVNGPATDSTNFSAGIPKAQPVDFRADTLAAVQRASSMSNQEAAAQFQAPNTAQGLNFLSKF